MHGCSVRRVICWSAALLIVPAIVGCGEPERLPPDQVIQKSGVAMDSARSFHFAFEASKPSKPLPGFFISKAEGDVAKPDKLAGEVTATFGGVPLNVKVVVDGQSQFMTDPASGKWNSMSAAVNVAQFFDPGRGVSDILSSVKSPSAGGVENIEGVDSYRIDGTVPTSALSALSPEVTAQADLTTTLWIGSSDFLLRRVKLEGPISANEPADIARTITFKDYNKEVRIETPVTGQ